MANISADGGLKLRGYRAAVITTFQRGSRIIGATIPVFISFLFFITTSTLAPLPSFSFRSFAAFSRTRTHMVADSIFPAYYRENPRVVREKNRIEIGFGLLVANYHPIVAARLM